MNIFRVAYFFQNDAQLINIHHSWHKIVLIINVNLYQNKYKVKQAIIIKYYHAGHKTGLEDVRHAWLLADKDSSVRIKTIIHQGILSYRLPVLGKRISYRSPKKGMVKKHFIIYEPVYLFLF